MGGTIPRLYLRCQKCNLPAFGHSKPGYGINVCQENKVVSDDESRTVWKDWCEAKERRFAREMEMKRIRIEKIKCQEENKDLSKKVKDGVMKWKMLSLENETLRWLRLEELEKQAKIDKDLKDKEERELLERLERWTLTENEDEKPGMIVDDFFVGKDFENMYEKKMRPRRRSNFRRSGVMMGIRPDYVATLKEVHEREVCDGTLTETGSKEESRVTKQTGGLACRGVARLRCGASDLPARRLAWCTVKPDHEDLDDEDMEDLDDGKGAILG